MNICTACGNNFTSVTAFDRHQVWTDYGKPVKCDLTLVQPANRDPKFGPTFRLPDVGQFDWAKEGAERSGERACKTCTKPMTKRPGRGRFPSNCSNCGGTGIPVS